MFILFMLVAQAAPAADEAAALEALKVFEGVFSKSKDAKSKVEALAKLAEVKHEKIIAKLANLISHDEKAVRIATGDALASFVASTPELKKSAGKALTSGLSAGANVRDTEVLIALLTALGALQEESTALSVQNYYENKDTKIASASVTASGQIRSKTLVEPLISLLRECEKITQPPPPPSGGKGLKGGYGGAKKGAPPSQQNDAEQQKHERAQALQPLIQAALQSITMKTDIPTGEKWQEWWSKNRATFTVSKP